MLDTIHFVEKPKNGDPQMTTYKIRLSNPTSHQVGQLTLKSWDKDSAISEAKKKLEPMGFTTVLSCEMV